MAKYLKLAVIGALVVSCAQDPTPAPVASLPDRPGSATESGSDRSDGQAYPEVRDASVTRDADGTFTATVTLSSPYDSPQRYADAWRLLSPERDELSVRVLTHDHAGEQPFTRSQSGIVIPEDVDQVIVQGRDLVNGWGGAEITVDLMR